MLEWTRLKSRAKKSKVKFGKVNGCQGQGQGQVQGQGQGQGQAQG